MHSYRSPHGNNGTRVIFEIFDLLVAFIASATTIVLRKALRVMATFLRLQLTET
jgi:hypothetical protein